MNPLLLVHISAGTLGVLSGAGSMMARKGTRLHARAGTVFVAAMITMGVTGSLVAVARWLVSGHAYQVGNFLMGLFTAYLTVTGWMTGRRRVKEVGWQDGVWLAVGMLVAGSFAGAGISTAADAVWLQHGLGAPFFFVVGSVAALAVAGDLRWLASRGVTGAVRLRRHLWRMCTAMFIAVLSFFLGQAKVLPVWLVRTHLNSVPVLVTFLYLIFWLVRMRARKAEVITTSPTVVPGSLLAGKDPLSNV